MTRIVTHFDRRSFLKVSAAAGGGLLIGFSWLTRCTPASKKIAAVPKEWFDINGYIRIGDTGLVTIYSPNPEIGQNVMTSMPMIVAEELDVDWSNVVVAQGDLDEDAFQNPQFAGGSLSIKLGWDALRMAGATGRRMLLEAAAKLWEVSVEELTVSKGVIRERNGSRTIGYGEIAPQAVGIEIPEEVELKDPKDFQLIGTYQKNVEGHKIVTGKPQFGLDFEREGMLLAMIHHPPAFGQVIRDFNVDEIKQMEGIRDAFLIDTSLPNGSWATVNAFNILIAIVGDTTWQLMKAKKALRVNYEQVSEPENSRMHTTRLQADMENGEIGDSRLDGDPDAEFARAETIVERTYSSPFMAHNTLEPMNFFAHVETDRAELIGPVQTPKALEEAASALLGIPPERITVGMTRQGGGFGRRLYVHFGLEAAIISRQMQAPVKLIYTREDDMTQGTYRPAYLSSYRAALDAEGRMVAFSVRGVGLPEGPVFPDRFPAGSLDHYSAQKVMSRTNISTGAWRAPRSHFTAGVEQAFLDEVAEAAGKDPIAFRLELLERAKTNPVGADIDYDPDRYAGVLKRVRDESGWGRETPGVFRGVAAYYCHYSYVAQVVDIVIEKGQPIIQKVWCAVDCGIVVNKEGAINMIEGGIIDGIGHAMYSELHFENGGSTDRNFDTYRLIRHAEAPREIAVFFVESDTAPTGLGEPGLPPVVGALSNALYRATGRRYYHQPFVAQGRV